MDTGGQWAAGRNCLNDGGNLAASGVLYRLLCAPAPARPQ